MPASSDASHGPAGTSSTASSSTAGLVITGGRLISPDISAGHSTLKNMPGRYPPPPTVSVVHQRFSAGGLRRRDGYVSARAFASSSGLSGQKWQTCDQTS